MTTVLKKELRIYYIIQHTVGAKGLELINDMFDPMDMSLSNLREMVKDRETWHAAVHGVTKSWTQLSDRTTMKV